MGEGGLESKVFVKMGYCDIFPLFSIKTVQDHDQVRGALGLKRKQGGLPPPC